MIDQPAYPNADVLAGCARHTRWSAPGPWSKLLRSVSSDLPSLCAAVRNIAMHWWEVRRNRIQLSDEQLTDNDERTVAGLIERAIRRDPRPLTELRPPESMLVIDCRGFSQLLVAFLRERNVPARVRFGFARYVAPPNATPPCFAHAICQRWNAAIGRWEYSDADVRLPEVSADAFFTARHAWRILRREPDRATQFGFADNTGLAIVGAELIADSVSRSGFDRLYGDAWGLLTSLQKGGHPVTPGEAAILDALAECDDSSLAAFIAAEPLLALPSRIRHYSHSTKQSTIVDVV